MPSTRHSKLIYLQCYEKKIDASFSNVNTTRLHRMCRLIQDLLLPEEMFLEMLCDCHLHKRLDTVQSFAESCGLIPTAITDP